MTARIYDRPDLDQELGLRALYVTGRFPGAEPSAPYEGRLQIKNGVGACLVRQIDGDRLPEGHRLYVDQATQEVVLAWPAYQSGQAPIVNPGFEAGDSGWVGGPGWKIATENPPTGLWAAGYLNNQGESRISSTSRYSVFAGQVTHAKCQVRQGASSEGNAGASVMLEYRNADGDVIESAEGNRVMSASKNRVYDSNVTGVAPAGAATINVAGNGIRYRENKILFVDTFEWDHTVPSAGINYEQLLNLSLLVSDSRGRSYLWKGTVSVVLWDGAWESRTRGSMEWRGVPYAIKFNGVGRLLTGGHDGKIWRSDDRGQNWTLTDSPLANTPYYTRAFAYNDRDQVLVACGHYVARSLDGGATWGRTYTPYDSAWVFAKWIPEWNIFIVVGAGAYTRRILTLNAGGAGPLNKSNTGGYYNITYSAVHDRAVCLPHAESGGQPQYAVCTGDPTASAWSYFNPPSGTAINSRYGAASLPNGDVWTVGSDSTTNTGSGYMISRDGGLTFERPIRPSSLPGVPAGYDLGGMVVYDETLRLLVIQAYQSGPGAGSARQFISRDNGATFQPTDIPAPLSGTNMARPEGVQWSPSAGCIIGSDTDSNPTIYFSRTGLFK